MNKLQVFEKAMSYYGLEEKLKTGFNPIVLEMLNSFHEVKITKNLPWCAAFVNHVLKECGHKHSSKLNARSLLKIGKKVNDPGLGDIVVLWRGKEDSWKGHVGFYAGVNNDIIYILGGNQNNSVCIRGYSKSRLLSFRSIPVKIK